MLHNILLNLTAVVIITSESRNTHYSCWECAFEN